MNRYLRASMFSLLFIFASVLVEAQSWVLKFDPSQSESYIDCGNLDEYSLNEFTIEAWLYVDSWSGNYIMANESWKDASGSVGFAFRFGSNGQLEMNIGTGTWESVKSSENSIKLRQWQHLAVSFDSEKLLKLYVDGILVKQGTISKQMLHSPTKLFMGEGSMWQGRGLDGKLSDVRIWNVARSADDINANKAIHLKGDENGLIANWLLNEGQGNVLADQTTKFNRTKGTGTSWILKNMLQVNGSLKILNQGKDSVLVEVSNEVVTDWTLDKVVATGKASFKKMDDHSAFLIYEVQATTYKNDTIFIVAVTSDKSKIQAKVAVDLYDNKYQYDGEKLLDQIHTEFYNKSNGLYAEAIDASSQFKQATSFVWPASHMLRALMNAWKLNPKKYEMLFFNYLAAVDQYKTTKSGRTGFAVLPGNQGTRFYDDNGQLVMQFCSIYDLTKDNTTLERLKIAYEFCNGIRDSRYAIPQHEDQLGYGMLFSMSVNYTSYAAAKLYQITNDIRYLNEALAYYEKENDLSVKIKDAGTKLFNQTSYYQNGTWSLNGIVNGSNQWGGGYRAYQTTVVIQNAILLYQITKEQKYLDDANEMMTSCINRWYKQGQGLSENSFWGGDDMIDALMDMYRETADQKFLTIALDIMDFLAAHNCDKRGYYASDGDDSKGKWNLYRTSLNPSEISMMGQAAAASSFLNVAFNSKENSTGINEITTSETPPAILVFPNPAHSNEMLKIHVPEKPGVNCDLRLYNQSGQLVQMFESSQLTNSQQIVARLSVKTPGIYFIMLNTEYYSYQSKLVIR